MTELLLFPLTKRVGKIRHTADLLSQRHGKDADAYWKQVRTALQKQLARVSIEGPEADQHIRQFSEAVQAELVRRNFEPTQSGQPGESA